MTYREVERLIEAFEQGTYPAADWTHRSHLLMALWYTWHEPLPIARDLIKEGIKNYNLRAGGENTDESGYHETLTELYIQAIVQYQLFFVGGSFELLLENLDSQPFADPTFPARHYRKDRLMSREARKRWVAPDRQPLLGCTFNDTQIDRRWATEKGRVEEGLRLFSPEADRKATSGSQLDRHRGG